MTITYDLEENLIDFGGVILHNDKVVSLTNRYGLGKFDPQTGLPKVKHPILESVIAIGRVTHMGWVEKVASHVKGIRNNEAVERRYPNVGFVKLRRPPENEEERRVVDQFVAALGELAKEQCQMPHFLPPKILTDPSQSDKILRR